MYSKLLDIRYLLGVLRRRWYLLLVPTVLGSMIAVFVANALPPTYLSTARILVESQQIPTDLARSTVAIDTAERVRVIQQRLTTRENLLDLAEQFDVFADYEDLSPTETVDMMRAAISLGGESSSQRRRDRTVSTVVLSFRARRADTAAQVASALLTEVLEQNAQQRATRAAETLDFFSREVDRLGDELSALEVRIVDFKNANQEALPQNVNFMRNEIVSIQGQRERNQITRAELEDRRELLERRLAQGQTSVGALGGVTPQDRQLANLRVNLAQQRAIYSDSHPVIRQLLAQISALEDVQSAPLGNNVQAEDAGEAEADAVAPPVSDAMFELERVQDSLRRLDEVDAALDERELQLESNLGRVPQVESALRELERDRDALRSQYQEALGKKAEAETGERLEVNRQAERFEVIEQPRPADKPIAPNRLMIAGGGAVASIGFGLALMVLAELLNPALRSSRDLERLLQIRPLATIPYIRTEKEILRRKRYIRLAVLLLLILPAIVLFGLDRYVAPLPELAQKAGDRIGVTDFVDQIRRRLGF
jgi:polysaccharide chain length determinant protein (PEP-CTERM system associated)